MNQFRFAVISDLHIALPQTILNGRNRFHLVEVSIPALEIVLEHLKQLNIDFLLIPGDLTQDGEPENHQWLQQRLERLPFPVYVIPGNHDVPTIISSDRAIALKDFPNYYSQFGYTDTQEAYYSQEILPGVQLIGLNSNQFNDEGEQIGSLDSKQLQWLEATLEEAREKLVLVMVHHNVIEHLPGQSRHELGKRYMLDNAPLLLEIFKKYGVNLLFTGHLHVQDIAEKEGISEITTGSLVSYPHPYRVLELITDAEGKKRLKIETHRVEAVPGWENLSNSSREWMGDRSFPFMVKLLTSPPSNLSQGKAEKLAPKLRYFWADLAGGDALFQFPEFPEPARSHFQKFGAIAQDGKPALIDNNTTLII